MMYTSHNKVGRRLHVRGYAEYEDVMVYNDRSIYKTMELVFFFVLALFYEVDNDDPFLFGLDTFFVTLLLV